MLKLIDLAAGWLAKHFTANQLAIIFGVLSFVGGMFWGSILEQAL